VLEQGSEFDESRVMAILLLVPDPARYLEHWRPTARAVEWRLTWFIARDPL